MEYLQLDIKTINYQSNIEIKLSPAEFNVRYPILFTSIGAL
jgi:hypothetical protein